jgi:hypothetical protein
MDPDCSRSQLYTLAGARKTSYDWPELYAHAVADECGQLMSREAERLCAVDELLARSPPELVLLGELAAYASLPRLAEGCRRPLQRTVAGLVRLLDRALATHGRDVGYRVEHRRDGIATTAGAGAAFLRRDGDEDHALPLTLGRAGESLAEAIIALPRPRGRPGSTGRRRG